jgi:glycosyltransferase involved in cell wall biosynthesis
VPRGVAHVHLSQGGSLLREGLLVLLLRLRRVPVVTTLHGSSTLTAGKASFLVTGLILRCANLAHFLSDAHRRRYARISGRSVTIPNVVDVDVDPAALPYKRPDVVFAGVVGPRKGVDVLLEAWGAVTEPGWCLHVYGPPESGFSVPAVGPSVVVHGEVPPEQVRAALAGAAIAVLPSREEAFPMFLLEAMAHRCAVVASDLGGVRDLVGPAGVVVPVGDAQALGTALADLTAQADRRTDLAAAAAERARERFDPDTVARTWADAYRTLAGEPAAAGRAGA